MSQSGSSSARKRSIKKATFPSSELAPPPAATPAAIGPFQLLPLVPCPCCRFRRTVRLVSRSEANPGRVFYKCPNHRGPTNPCNHYYWEDGDDNYVDYLLANGYIGIGDSSAVDNATEAKEEEEAGPKNEQSVQKMDQCLKKLDELIELCRKLLFAVIALIAIMVYAAVAK